MNRPLWRMIAGLVVFSAAFGYVEAAVVVYLRSIYAPLRAHLLPAVPSGELFPLLSLDQLRVLGTEHIQRIKIELGREFGTLLMLTGAALAATRKSREWLPAFLVCFGIWDITFYIFLKLLLNWPASLLTWDILFLLPVPWVGPVIAPILVSASMIVAGLLVLWREHLEKPVHIDALRWVLIGLGAVIVFAAFIADFRNTSKGGNPNAFHWGVFFTGEVIGLAAFASALLRSEPRTK
ncbi:MAG: hypothetical protein WB992_04100 [Bryobacteraceae bacterium]